MDAATPSAHESNESHDWPVGAHLVTPRRGYSHHGIYAGRGRVIHYSGFSRGWRRGPVEEVSLDAFCQGRPISVRSTDSARHHGTTCAERARQRIGEDRFSLWSNNCEHFCNWCVHGVGRSAQIEAMRERLASLLGRFAVPRTYS